MVEKKCLYNCDKAGRSWVKSKSSFYSVLCLICLSTCCLLKVSYQNSNDILKYDYTNLATDATAINNKAVLGPNVTFPNTVETCSKEYLKSDSNMCICSRAGLYINLGNSTAVTQTIRISGFDTHFQDHETNSMAARIFVNPLTVIGYPTKHTLIKLVFGNETFSLSTSYTLSPPGTQGVSFGITMALHNTLIYYDTSTPLITAPSWVDIVITFQYIQNAPGYINMEENVYSSSWKEALPQLYSEPNDNLPMNIKASGMKFELNNHHYSDFTIQYISVYGGRQPLDSISLALCAVPIIVPPEYCLAPSTAFLKNGCTDSVNGTCNISCSDFPCAARLRFLQGCPIDPPPGGSSSSSSSSKSTKTDNYVPVLSTQQIVGVMIGVSFAVDSILVLMFICLSIFCRI